MTHNEDNNQEHKGIIENIAARVAARVDGDTKESWTAQLLAGPKEKIIKKFGEEAVELVMAAQAENIDEVIHESADTLYHMIVLWRKLGVTVDSVGEELKKREASSGLAEKASRPDNKQ